MQEAQPFLRTVRGDEDEVAGLADRGDGLLASAGSEPVGGLRGSPGRREAAASRPARPVMNCASPGFADCTLTSRNLSHWPSAKDITPAGTCSEPRVGSERAEPVQETGDDQPGAPRR
jgi:hypothetical protein